MRFIVQLLLGVVAFWLLRKWLFSGSAPKRPPVSAPPTAGSSQPAGLVACSHCGVHLPASEALRQGDEVFCSEAHRQADVQAHVLGQPSTPGHGAPLSRRSSSSQDGGEAGR